jgi:MFS transporter, DHA3 family, macrolide efflux protein
VDIDMNQEGELVSKNFEHKTEMKKFKLLVLGQFISSIGSGLTDFGLAIYILSLTGSVMATSIVSICAFLPAILLAPIGGVLADRYDRKLMMLLGELFSGLGLVICLLSIMSGSPTLLVISLGVGISSIFLALVEPAFKAIITDLLPPEEFVKASGMVQIAGSAKLIISPVIAGFLLQMTTISTLLILDILTFFTTTLIIVFVMKGMAFKQRENENDRLSFVKELKDGLQAIHGQKGIVTMIVIMTSVVFCLGFVQILSKPLVLTFADETKLGILTTISALGMMVGSIVISCLPETKSEVKMLSTGLIGCGLFFALMGIRANLWMIALFGFLMFVFMPAIQVGAEVLIRKNLDNEVQGRAFGLIGFITQMGYILAYMISGVLADYVFEPFMKGNSLLAIKVGNLIGHGIGRGIALLLLISGMALLLLGIIVSKLKSVKRLERNMRNEPIIKPCPEGL